LKKLRTSNTANRKKKNRKSTKKGIAVYPPDKITEGLNESNDEEEPLKNDDLKLVESQQ